MCLDRRPSLCGLPLVIGHEQVLDNIHATVGQCSAKQRREPRDYPRGSVICIVDNDIEFCRGFLQTDLSEEFSITNGALPPLTSLKNYYYFLGRYYCPNDDLTGRRKREIQLW